MLKDVGALRLIILPLPAPITVPAALRLAKEAAGIPQDVDIRLQVFPPKKALARILWEWLLGDGEDDDEGQVTAALTRGLDNAGKHVKPFIAPGVLTMPRVERLP